MLNNIIIQGNAMGQHRDWGAYTRYGNLYFNFSGIDDKYKQTGPNDCWLWTGPLHRQGYGMTGGVYADSNKRFMTVVHRPLMMRHLARELAGHEFVIKTCSNHKCCNTAHYILGDHKVKTDIMKQNDRIRPGPKVAGKTRKQNRVYRHSEAEIQWIRDASSKDIAERYGLTINRAGHLRWGFRKGFTWLPWPNDPNLKGKENE